MANILKQETLHVLGSLLYTVQWQDLLKTQS